MILKKIKVQLERTGDDSVLELNVTLPEFHERPTPAVTPAIAEVEAKAEKTTETTVN